MTSSSTSCGPFQYEADGRNPIGAAQGMGSDYPLVNPSADIQYLIADLHLSYDDPGHYDGSYIVLPLRIKYLYGLGCLSSSPPPGVTPIHAADIIVVDSNDMVVFDSTTSDSTYATNAWSSRLQIHEWTSNSQVLRLVEHTKWADDGTPVAQDYDLHITPTSAVLDVRTLHAQPARVRKLIVNGLELKGDVEFEIGYNIAIGEPTPPSVPIVSEDSAPRKKTSLQISAIPGAGAGQYPGCGEVNIAIRKINGTPPDEYGNFLLSPRDCVWYERPGVLTTTPSRIIAVEPNTIKLNDDCTPCCECQDYVEVKLAIDRLYNRSKELAKDAEEVRDTLRDNINRWETYKACRESKPYKLYTIGSCSGIVGVAFAFCNMDKDCNGPLDVTFDVKTYEGGTETSFTVDVIKPHTRRSNPITGRLEPYTLDGSPLTWSAHWDVLMGRSGGRVQFFLQACSSTDGAAVQVTATPTFAGKTYPSTTQTASVESECDTSDLCASAST